MNLVEINNVAIGIKEYEGKRVERQYLHKTFTTLQPSKTSSRIQYIIIFSLLANPKGFGALAPSMRECAQKLQHGKRICIVGQVPTSTNQ